LDELNHKLKKFPGVSKVKIESSSSQLGYYGAAPTWWEATLVYDSAQLPLNKLVEMIEHQGYHPYKVRDKDLSK
jgi:copper chaperone CopZ